MVHIAATMMVKNEKARLHVTLNSIVGIANSLVMYDTGSTDNTIDIAKDICEKHGIIFRLLQGTFVNFSVSRNKLLEFANSFTDIDYLLLLDTNDEFQGGPSLIRLCEKHLNDSRYEAFMLRQCWWSKEYTNYFNVRLLKARVDWTYKTPVHEYITSNKPGGSVPLKVEDPDIVIYQDRNQDDGKTTKRFLRDKELLLEEVKKNPHDERSLFYLAQTCGCLGQNEESIAYYKLRIKEGKFAEEVFHSYNRIGKLMLSSKSHPWHECMFWFLKAIELFDRAEPALAIAKYYKDIKHWKLATAFAELACSYEYPKDTILFVDDFCYRYERWHVLGIVAYYAGKYSVGKEACKKAIEYARTDPNIKTDIDKQNIVFYEGK